MIKKLFTVTFMLIFFIIIMGFVCGTHPINELKTDKFYRVIKINEYNGVTVKDNERTIIHGYEILNGNANTCFDTTVMGDIYQRVIVTKHMWFNLGKVTDIYYQRKK